METDEREHPQAPPTDGAHSAVRSTLSRRFAASSPLIGDLCITLTSP